MVGKVDFNTTVVVSGDESSEYSPTQIDFGVIAEELNIGTQLAGSSDNPNLSVQPQSKSEAKPELTRQQRREIAQKFRKELNKTKSNQGLLGKGWNWFKNKTGIGAGSDKTEAIISKFEQGQASVEEVQNSLKSFSEGQSMFVDVFADIVSGVAAVGIYTAAVAAAPFSGGASIACGVAAASVASAGIKTGLKYTEAKLAGNEYSWSNVAMDAATGAVSGVLAPITGGIGGAAGKTVATKLGIKAVQEGSKLAAKETLAVGTKTGIKAGIIKGLYNPTGYKYVGGTMFKRGFAFGTECAVDGALGGSLDNMFRASINGENVFEAGVTGLFYGATLSPVIGGSFKIVGKGASKTLDFTSNLKAKKLLDADGFNNVFKQGSTPDCSLLSTINGILNNPKLSRKLKNITTNADGSFNVKIGDEVVIVPKSALNDGSLSNSKFIRAIEEAYKKAAGNLGADFADNIAKQFDLNPIHIKPDDISDELLSQLAKDRDNLILSLGMKITKNGNIDLNGDLQHYFNIKFIDVDKKIVTLVDPADTTKTIQMSFDDIKRHAISIDGGSIKKTDLPTSTRQAGDVAFGGKKNSKVPSETIQIKNDLLAKIGCDEQTIQNYLQNINGVSLEGLVNEVRLRNISVDEVADFIAIQLQGRNLSECSDEIFTTLFQSIILKNEFKNSSLLDGFNLSLNEVSEIKRLFATNDLDEIYYKILSCKNDDLALLVCDHENFYHELKKLIDSSVYKFVTSENDILHIGKINGKSKSVVFPNATSIISANVEFNDTFIQCLIKSNIITKDILDIITNLKIELPTDDVSAKFNPYNIKTRIKSDETDLTKLNVQDIIKLNVQDIIKKFELNGIDSLTSHEIHVLTDCFSDLYNKNVKLQKALKKSLNNNQDVKALCSLAEHLKTIATGRLDPTIKIEDHLIMRMIDRNLLTVTENVAEDGLPKTLSFVDLIEIINDYIINNKNNITGGDDPLIITGYNGASGIKLLLNRSGENILIKSIM